MDSTVGESSPPDRVQLKDKAENHEPLGLHIQQLPTEGESHQRLTAPFMHYEFRIEGGIEAAPSVEHQFIPCSGRTLAQENTQSGHSETRTLAALRNRSTEDPLVSLQLGEPDPKRRRQFDSPLRIRSPERSK